jgi:hypothetical protein
MLWVFKMVIVIVVLFGLWWGWCSLVVGVVGAAATAASAAAPPLPHPPPVYTNQSADRCRGSRLYDAHESKEKRARLILVATVERGTSSKCAGGDDGELCVDYESTSDLTLNRKKNLPYIQYARVKRTFIRPFERNSKKIWQLPPSPSPPPPSPSPSTSHPHTEHIST